MSIALIIFTQIFLDIHLSELTLNSSILGLIISSLLFSSYSKQLLNYEQTLNERNSELQLLTTLDGLTGAFNKRAFKHISETLFNKQKHENKPLLTLFIDLDHFKNVNDTYGHDAGDKVLIYFSDMIRGLINHETIFSRIGGEEFALLVPNINVDEGYILTKNILHKIEAAHIFYNDQVIQVTVSIGISDMQHKDHSFLELYSRADKALYQAKESGRNRYIYLNA